jgi:UPF0716 protein FxsA
MLAIFVLLFVVLPLVEIYVAIQVGHVIGALNTVALLILFSVAGAWIAKQQGFSVLRRMRISLDAGRMPGNELIDAGLVLAGGLLLIVPGFVTDAVGLLLLLPPTRSFFRNALKHRLRSRVQRYTIRPAERPGEPPRAIGPDDIIDV